MNDLLMTPGMEAFRQRLAEEYQAERLAAAKALGKYSLEAEWDTILDEAWEHLSHHTIFEEFQNWIKGYMYYTALVCTCNDSDEVETQLRSDYEKVMRELSPD